MDDSTLLYESIEKKEEEKKQIEENQKEHEDLEKYRIHHEDVSNEILADESYFRLKEQELRKEVNKNMPDKLKKEDKIKPLEQLAKEADVAERIPENLEQLLQNIIDWEGHGTHKDTSEPLIAAAKKMIKLRDEYDDYDTQDAQEMLLKLMETSMFYLKENAGYRFSKKGDRRKDAVRDLIKATEDYAFQGGARYIEAFGNSILFRNIGKSKSLAEMRKSFRFKLTMETQEPDFYYAIEVLKSREKAGDVLFEYDRLVKMEDEHEAFDGDDQPLDDKKIAELLEIQYGGNTVEDDPDLKEIDDAIKEFKQKQAEAELEAGMRLYDENYKAEMARLEQERQKELERLEQERQKELERLEKERLEREEALRRAHERDTAELGNLMHAHQILTKQELRRELLNAKKRREAAVRAAQRRRDLRELNDNLRNLSKSEFDTVIEERGIDARNLRTKRRAEIRRRRNLIFDTSRKFNDATNVEKRKETKYEDILALKAEMAAVISELSGYEADRFIMLPADMLRDLLVSMDSDLADKKKMKENLLINLEKAKESLTDEKLEERMKDRESFDDNHLYREYAAYSYAKNTAAFRNNGTAFTPQELKNLSNKDLHDLSESARVLLKAESEKGEDIETLREAAIFIIAQRSKSPDSDIDTDAYKDLPWSVLFDMAKKVLTDGVDKSNEQLRTELTSSRDEFTGVDHMDMIRQLAHEAECGNKVDAANLRELCIFELTKDSAIKRTDILDLSALTLYRILEDKLLHNAEDKSIDKTDKLLLDLQAERKAKLTEASNANKEKAKIEDYLKAEGKKLEDAYELFAAGKYIEKGKIKTRMFGFGPSKNDIKKEREKTDAAKKELVETKAVTIIDNGEKVVVSYIAAINHYKKIAEAANTSAGKLARRIKEQDQLAAMEAELEKSWLKNRIEEERVRATSRPELRVDESEKMICAKAIDEETPWSEDAVSALDLIGELVSGDDVYDEKGNVVAQDKKVRKILSSHSDVLIKLAEARKAEKPEIPGWGGPLGEVQGRISDDQRSLLSNIKGSYLDKVLDKINELAGGKKLSAKTLGTILRSAELNDLLNAYDDVLSGAIDAGDAMLQKQLDSATENMFGGSGEAMKDLWELYDYKYDDKNGTLVPLTKDEIREKKAEEEAYDRKEKLAKIRDMVFDTKKGQGRFLDQVFKGYYKNSSDSERRFMMSYVIKDMKPRKLRENSRQRGGAYFASMLKGAGPLMQKLFQGVPEQMLPAEFKSALSVVKSDLRPIPDNYVQKKLDEIRDASGGKISSINKIRSLGAASIAETYLCDVTYAKTGETQEVVVKLLRPDVKRRMENEKKFIIDCAKKTDGDGVMEASFNAHLTKIYEELNFKNEGKNIVSGKIYEGKELTSVKLNKDIPAGEDYIVMNKAEGVTLDRYIEETKGYGSKILEKYINPDVTSDSKYIVNRYKMEEYYKDRQALEEKLSEVEERYSHIEALVAKWIDEALFESRFHHGDLHAGNIMINDQKATVLDYGNATQLPSDKVKAIVKMMAAAFFGNTENYIEGLEKLLALDKGNTYNSMEKEQKNAIKGNLEKELKEIFSLGSRERTGEKIFVSLLKCQELGIKLPREVQNFSQCEQRLENTINEFRTVVESLRTALNTLDRAPVVVMGTTCFDPIAQANRNVGSGLVSTTAIKEDQKLLTAYMDPTEEKVKSDLRSKDPEDFDRKYMRDFIKLKEGMAEAKEQFDTINKNAADIRKRFEGLKKYKGMSYEQIKEKGMEKDFNYCYLANSIITNALMMMPDECLNLFGGNFMLNRLAGEAFAATDEEAFEKFMDVFEKQIPVALSIAASLEKARKTKKDPAKSAAEDEFVKKYVELKTSGVMDLESTKEFMEVLSPEIVDHFRILSPYEAVLSGLKSKGDKEFYWKKNEKGEYQYGEYSAEFKEAFEETQKYEARVDELTPKEKEEFEKAKERLRRASMFAVQFVAGMDEDNALFEKQCAIYFEDKKYGKQLRAAYDERRRLQDLYIKKLFHNEPDEPEVKKQRIEAEKRFMLIFRRVVYKHALVRDKYYRHSGTHGHYVKGFINVMQDVLGNHEIALGKMVGIGNAIEYKKQL